MLNRTAIEKAISDAETILNAGCGCTRMAVVPVSGPLDHTDLTMLNLLARKRGLQAVRDPAMNGFSKQPLDIENVTFTRAPKEIQKPLSQKFCAVDRGCQTLGKVI